MGDKQYVLVISNLRGHAKFSLYDNSSSPLDTDTMGSIASGDSLSLQLSEPDGVVFSLTASEGVSA